MEDSQWLQTASVILAGFVALQHFGFLYLEMFLWTGPVGQKVFGMSAQKAKETAVLGANQGLYNGFLAMGLVWSLFGRTPEIELKLRLFFLTCVLVAALYGWRSVSYRIFLIQGVPALLALIFTILLTFVLGYDAIPGV